ncbi:hypothetical protein J2848_005229 [Azospirillum lipoferum]|uniref:Uncharacterized protein n=1 Tax=Azospirillum lipoferum TaxID=193 RepID=A0A5A9GFE1_AZOLI|nr:MULTISPECIES: hypothetical protein [Azospirillum]KAA0593131.1 hypothetical protein FZ942_24640 [Azospirillum lipoferum]MCP1613533.1 hypothetical protein [Azospirillum lipoferum]MDW5532302.1 hypothetical protein [Azospirillum sp. NL1]
MPTIYDIAQLQPLAAIGRAHGVRFRLRGGVATRLVMQMDNAAWGRPADLFSLTPFLSDVDLVHSGQPKQTRQIMEAIQGSVPGAECVRWELWSKEDEAAAQADWAQGNLIPARLLSIGDDPLGSVADPAGGLEDLRKRHFRYVRTPLYLQSPLFRAGRDLEVFSALLFLQTLAEAGISDNLDTLRAQSGWAAVQAVFADARSDWIQRRRLEEHAPLRDRLVRLVLAAIAWHRTPREFHQVATASGLRAYLTAVTGPGNPVQLPDPLHSFLTDEFSPSHDPWAEPSAFCISPVLGGDSRRLPLVLSGALWTNVPPPNLPPLAAGLQIALVSPPLPVAPGGAVTGWPGSMVDPMSTVARLVSDADEFIHLHLWPTGTARPVPAACQVEDLSALLLLEGEQLSEPVVIAPACVAERRSAQPGAGLSLRLNCYGALAALARSASLSARIILVHLGNG